MINKKGFIMFELLIIMAVFSIVLLFNLLFFNQYHKDIYLKEVDVLKTQLNKVKTQAINSNMIIHLKFYQRTLLISYDGRNQEINFNNLYFMNSKELYLNAKGVLNQAYTLNFKNGLKFQKIIFYLGKGWYRIE